MALQAILLIALAGTCATAVDGARSKAPFPTSAPTLTLDWWSRLYTIPNQLGLSEYPMSQKNDAFV